MFKILKIFGIKSKIFQILVGLINNQLNFTIICYCFGPKEGFMIDFSVFLYSITDFFKYDINFEINRYIDITMAVSREQIT